MKNTIKILMCAILAFAFMGCTKSGEENNGRLATPKFTINVEGNTLIVAWEEISGAAHAAGQSEQIIVQSDIRLDTQNRQGYPQIRGP